MRVVCLVCACECATTRTNCHWHTKKRNAIKVAPSFLCTLLHTRCHMRSHLMAITADVIPLSTMCSLLRHICELLSVDHVILVRVFCVWAHHSNKVETIVQYCIYIMPIVIQFRKCVRQCEAPRKCAHRRPTLRRLFRVCAALNDAFQSGAQLATTQRSAAHKSRTLFACRIYWRTHARVEKNNPHAVYNNSARNAGVALFGADLCEFLK